MANRISLYQPVRLDELPKAENLADLEALHLSGRVLETRPPEGLTCRPPGWSDHDDAEKRFFFNGKTQDSFAFEYPFPPARLAVLPQAQLAGQGYAIITGDNRVLSDSYSSPDVLAKGGHFSMQNIKVVLDGETQSVPFILKKPFPESRTIVGPALLAADYWQFNYHHWIVECLPRLRFALDNPGIPVVVPAGHPPFQQESLDLLGVEENRRLSFAGGEWRFEKLYFPTPGVLAPQELAWLRNLFLENLEIEARPKDIIYISRSDAAGRRLVNEPEVTAWLSSVGAKILTLTGMPLAEQIAHFAGARLVIGPHGSGLTNLIFSHQDAVIFELLPQDSINHVYWLMANAMGQRYTFLSGPVETNMRGFRIPLARIKAGLSNLLI